MGDGNLIVGIPALKALVATATLIAGGCGGDEADAEALESVRAETKTVTNTRGRT